MNRPEFLTFGVFHLFSGSGGGALGFQRAEEEYLGFRGRYTTLGGVDVDPDACADFTMLTGVPATVLDLFSRDDYQAFHGNPPPATWREAVPEDLRRAAGGVRPDVIFTSAPCKGLSALLPGAQASTPKYQALNRLTVRGIALSVAAWADDLPGLIIFENVPRITGPRGSALLDQIEHLLRSVGYVVDRDTHDLGAVGALAQHRRRFLLVARLPKKVPAPLYKPPLRKVRAIGSEIGRLPWPGNPDAGPMHRLPRLNWLTWVRLALIPAGGDWRDLQTVEPGSYRIQAVNGYYGHSYGVKAWHDPAATITSARHPSSGAVTVADPRLGHVPRTGVYQVARWDVPCGTVVGAARAAGSNGVAAVADPRLPSKAGRHAAHYRVARWEAPGHTVTGASHIANGMTAVADPRLTTHHGATFGGSPGLYGVNEWRRPAPAVTASMVVSGSNTPAAVQDPRLGCAPRTGAYRVVRWEDAAPTVTGSGDVHTQGAAVVADPRLPDAQESGAWIIIAEDGTCHRPLTTLELAVLQGFPAVLPDGRPLVLAGRSQTKWRERIGNAVPPPAAEAIGQAMLLALIPSRLGLLAWNVWQTMVWVRTQWNRIQGGLRARQRTKGR